MASKKQLSAAASKTLLATLQIRFEQNMHRHMGIDWKKVQQQLQANPDKLWSLNEMEQSGGEPDLVTDATTGNSFTFYDCAAESPKLRRSICYDRVALLARKNYPPAHAAVDMANEMGIYILTEEQYRHLQQFGSFDCKTSSWISTPEPIRKLGGALFCDKRYDTVFVYHNGADSYYGGRGFRGLLRI